jgi:hypothetical protein
LDVVRFLRFRKPRYRNLVPLMASGQRMSRREYEEWLDGHTWDPGRDTELVIQDDLAPAAWIEPLLAEGSFEVRMTVPQGFQAYARIFFPFLGAGADDDSDGGGEYVTWTQMARRHGRIAHALMEQETIATGPGADENGNGDDGAQDEPQCCGSLTPEQLSALLPILARHTASTDSWFLLWDGFGDLNERAFAQAPKVSHPMRELYLLHGPHRAYEDFPDLPSYWWPGDRAWCVCTDVDFRWAYLAGSAACIGEVLAVPVLDAYATSPENPARSGMDVINDPDGTIPRA